MKPCIPEYSSLMVNMRAAGTGFKGASQMMSDAIPLAIAIRIKPGDPDQHDDEQTPLHPSKPQKYTQKWTSNPAFIACISA
jgi:hypothetical protein